MKGNLEVTELERDNEILQTGGGIVLKFSVAMFQMVKIATELYHIL